MKTNHFPALKKIFVQKFFFSTLFEYICVSIKFIKNITLKQNYGTN